MTSSLDQHERELPSEFLFHRGGGGDADDDNFFASKGFSQKSGNVVDAVVVVVGGGEHRWILSIPQVKGKLCLTKRV